jgi:hypothetical protein
MFAPPRLLEPLQVHGASTREEYAAKQTAHVRALRAAYPAMRQWRDPWTADVTPDVFVSDGKWLVECDVCGNCPSVSLVWREARCFECGAVYANLTVPEQAAAIEAVLVQRPRMATRYWNPTISLDALAAENEALVGRTVAAQEDA